MGNVSKYTSPMDGMGIYLGNSLQTAVNGHWWKFAQGKAQVCITRGTESYSQMMIGVLSHLRNAYPPEV